MPHGSSSHIGHMHGMVSEAQSMVYSQVEHQQANIIVLQQAQIVISHHL